MKQGNLEKLRHYCHPMGRKLTSVHCSCCCIFSSRGFCNDIAGNAGISFCKDVSAVHLLLSYNSFASPEKD